MQSSAETAPVSKGILWTGRIVSALPVLMLLFVRFLPMISIFEIRTLLPSSKVKAAHGHDH